MTTNFCLSIYLCIDAYKETDDGKEWLQCPKCGLKPKVWSFDNGNSTACGCGKDIYDHFSIHAESIMSHVKRNNGNVLNYFFDDLRTNWNHWVKTGEILFKHAGLRKDGRW